MDNNLTIALSVGGLAAVYWVMKSAKSRRETAAANAAYETEAEAELQKEGNAALLIRDKARYARNFAADMMDKSNPKGEREKFREKYEAAKSRALVDLLTIKDDFYRGVATHGVIDLLLAGNELDRARTLFDTLDSSLQGSIMSTNPAEYARLRDA